MRLFYPVLLCIALLGGCQPSAKSDKSTRLLYEGEPGSLLVQPAAIPVETPLTLIFSSAEPLVAVSGNVTGISMFMGRIPLSFAAESDNHMQWQTVMLLGACSDPKMQWQLDLQLTYADGRTETIRQVFQSSW